MAPASNVAGLPHHLADPIWRLTSGFYTIRAEGNIGPIPFIPTPPQMEVIRQIYVLKREILIIPKARQVRMSTLICLICLDSVLFGASVQVRLVDQDVASANYKMEEKVFYAFDRLPSQLRDTVWRARKIASPHATLKIDHLLRRDGDAIPTSVFHTGENARGTTNQILFMSEWPEVAVKDPVKSKEYLDGAWPSGQKGLRIIESTWKGGKTGECWPLVSPGLDPITGLPLPDEAIKPGMPKVLFFPWYCLPDRRIAGHPDDVLPAVREYFSDIEAQTGDKLDHEQMLWYQRVVWPLGFDGRHTYPSIIHECWNGQIEGAIWAKALSKARDAGNVADLPHDPAYEVDTFWDLGAPENQPCGYVQHIGGMHRFIDLDDRMDSDLPERIAHMKRKQDAGYRYGTHHLPHDAHQRQRNGIDFRTEFEREALKQGLTGRIIVLARTPDKTLGIKHARMMLQDQVQFHEALTKPLLEAAVAYRWKPDPSRDGHFLDEPVKDWSSHLADVITYLAEAQMDGHLPTQSNPTMLNLYFDAPNLKELANKMPEHPEQRVTVERAGKTFRYVRATPDPMGWLRVWRTPAPMVPYLVSCTHGALAVWSGPYRDANTGENKPAELVAACVPEQDIQPSVLLDWCALASVHYGEAPVIVDVTNLPHSVEELRKRGVGVMARRQPHEDRRLGQQSPETRKPGHTFTERDRLDAYQHMQAMLRDQKAALYCASSINQLMSCLTDKEGLPSLASGAKEHWVRCHALALHNISYSAPARQQRGIAAAPPDYRNSTPKKKKMA
jgi:hypothetical protein